MLVSAEWLRQPRMLWIAIMAVVATVTWWLTWPPRSWRRRIVLGISSAMLVVMVVVAWRLSAVEERWPEVREASLESASLRLGDHLRRTYDQVDRLTRAGVEVTDESRAAAFERLGRSIPTEGPEYFVTIFAPDGSPWVWAGRHRLAPVPPGDSIAVRWNRYYLLLEMRRHSEGGHTVLAGVVVSASEVTAEPNRSVAAQFRAQTRVGLEVFPPGEAPEDDPDVYDYTEPTTSGPRILFSVKPVPPEQGAAKERLLVRGRAAVSWLLLLFVVVSLTVVSRSRDRFVLLLALILVLLRTPLGEGLGMAGLFSSATFFRPLYGPFSTSVGMMAATGTVVTIIGVGLWRRRLRRTWIGVLIGVAALVTAPDLYRELGRGITPPSDGVSLTLWITWQLMMVVTASGLFLLAAAMFRGKSDITGNAWKLRIGLGVAMALGATLLGTVLWQQGWPKWYVACWIPPLFLVVMPAPRRATAAALAIVAGSSAALITWGAVLEGAVHVARREIQRLGDPDPLAVASLERFADRIGASLTFPSGADLYALWRRSDLSREGYPAQLAIWTADGERLTDLPIDSLSLISGQVRQAVVSMPPDSSRVIRSFVVVPGVHRLLLTRTDPETVVSVSIGPLTGLIARTPLGQTLDPEPESPPLYRISMSPPLPGRGVSDMRPLRWRRTGWSVLGEADFAFEGGVREARVEFDLGGPIPILVRGALLILLDVAVIALLWLLAEWIDGERIRMPDWRRSGRSFRVRLGGALALFFILPAVGFAAWSFVRLTDEVVRGRDLLTTHLLRDAATVSAGDSERLRSWDTSHLVDLSGRVNAEFWSYHGGRMRAVSAPILWDLGIVRPLLHPEAFLALSGAASQTVVGEAMVGHRRRVGYRIAEDAAPDRMVVLSTPQLVQEGSLDVRPLDLAFLLLLATLGGLGAALVAARWAAGALSRPVADLRQSAIAIGRGKAMPIPERTPPLEFEPVFGAFKRMEQDIRTSRADLEQARLRTSTVLATVATGVIGIDRDAKVLIANRRASEFLGVPLQEGTPLSVLDDDWRDLVSTAGSVLTDHETNDRTTELDVGDRRYSIHCASLGGDMGGAVIALTDVTDLAQAERVLAWGEMARQVAHEIKNPLTPMRLGVQHLQRVHREKPEALSEVLDATGSRILAEIDRLDRIARAFSRFASPSHDVMPLEEVDLAQVAGEVQQLYALGAEGASVQLEVEPEARGDARRDEVKEVFGNLVENARQAGATTIIIRVAPRLFSVADDGQGMSAEVAARVFEPRFSTTSSGAGLGLAIVRRQVESWGGTIEVESEEGEGTTVLVTLQRGN